MIDLDALAQAATCLDPLPTSVTRLAALICTGTPELFEVVEIVEFDEALTATLLRTANSSWSASRNEVTTVKDAVIRLGAGPVLSLALAVNVRSRMNQSIPEYSMAEGDLWSHSVAASLAADLLARTAAIKPPAETATAALLHDVGKLVMSRFLRDDVLSALEEAQAGGATRLRAETDVLGIHHAELGGLIAQAWSLPDTLVKAITQHHSPSESGQPIACAVYLADTAAKAIGAGLDDNPDLESFAYAIGELGLSADGFDEVCRVADQRFQEVSERYD